MVVTLTLTPSLTYTPRHNRIFLLPNKSLQTITITLTLSWTPVTEDFTTWRAAHAMEMAERAETVRNVAWVAAGAGAIVLGSAAVVAVQYTRPGGAGA